MELVLIEIILWVGLAFFLWVLRDNLANVESELQEARALKAREIAARAWQRRFVDPEQRVEPIGLYEDTMIHRYVVVDGRRYRFDYVSPPGMTPSIGKDQCCIAPGIVYRLCKPAASGN